MNKSVIRNLEAIKAGVVDKTNIIGIRKALNAVARLAQGYSISRIYNGLEVGDDDELVAAINKKAPRVIGDLAESGLAVLRNKRNRRKFTDDQHSIIENFDHFELADFYDYGHRLSSFTPVYRVVAKDGRSFDFYNLAWQSGGDGPQVID